MKRCPPGVVSPRDARPRAESLPCSRIESCSFADRLFHLEFSVSRSAGFTRSANSLSSCAKKPSSYDAKISSASACKSESVDQSPSGSKSIILSAGVSSNSFNGPFALSSSMNATIPFSRIKSLSSSLRFATLSTRICPRPAAKSEPRLRAASILPCCSGVTSPRLLNPRFERPFSYSEIASAH